MIRSTFARFIAFQLGLATLAVCAFAYFTWQRADYLLARRDDQIVTRELVRVAARGSVAAVRDDLEGLRAAGQRIAPDIFYVLVPDLARCISTASTIGGCMGFAYAAENALSVRPDWTQIALAAQTGSVESLQREVRISSPPVSIAAMRLERDGAILVGVDRSVLEGELFAFQWSIVLACTGVLLLSLGLAAVFLRRVLQSVACVGGTLDGVAAGRLGVRVPARRMPREIATIATHINAMLDQLESMFSSLRTFTKQIAHELKTPLTRVAARLANADAAEGAAALERRIAQSRSDLESALSLFDEFLQIATFEAAPRADREVIDLAAVVHEAVELYGACAADKNQSIDVAARPVLLAGHHGLLQRLIGNLLDNAIKYSPQGTPIRIGCGPGDGHGFLEICDGGPGLSQADRARIMRLGTRAEHAGAPHGAGFGLYVVKLIAEAHAMALRLDDNNPGLCIRLTFPRAGDSFPSAIA